MRVRSNVLQYFHLDKNYSLLSARNVLVIREYFNLLDIHKQKALNDLQFYEFMRQTTDLSKLQIYKVFDMLDVDGSGEMEFDEFYLLVCILIAIKDNEEKHFIYRHSRTVFDLLDEDGSNTISADEFEIFGFLFNFQGVAIKEIFNEFDVSGDQELDYKEFRMFAMACIDKQNELEEEQQRKAEEKRRKKLEREAKYKKKQEQQALKEQKREEKNKAKTEEMEMKQTQGTITEELQDDVGTEDGGMLSRILSCSIS